MFHKGKLILVTTIIISVLHDSKGNRNVAPIKGGGCPLPKAILPCRCLYRRNEYQLWCTHSDLTSVLEGLKATAKYIQDPIDEVILENNYLPSLPGRAFSPLKILRLMLRHNGLESVSIDWLSGLGNILMELYVVEPKLRSIPEESLEQLNAVQAITIETVLMKRVPLVSDLPKLKYLHLTSTSLNELTSKNFNNNPALEEIHIISCPQLIRLEKDLFHRLPNLRLINISYTGLTWIHPKAMNDLPVLQELILINNKINDASMVGRALFDLDQLEMLRLDNNLIEKLQEGSFTDIPSLRILHLSNNRISEIERGAISKMPQLRKLDLNGNFIRKIHQESFSTQYGNTLEELWIMNNKIGHVAELRTILDAFPRLVFLDMSYNNLEAIPFGSLRGHQTLEQLNLDHNSIHHIETESFVGMPALRELHLRNNSLTNSLVPPLWNLPQLKGLDLSRNQFKSLESNFLAELPSLRKIDISENHLDFIDPGAFVLTTALEFINISNNLLTNLHPVIFHPLLNLYELDMSNNAINDFFVNLPRGIEYLHMQNNNITTIPSSETTHLDLPALRTLDLTKNKIELLVKDTFLKLPQLRKLNLQKNVLKQLEGGCFRGLERLEVLDLMDNELKLLSPISLKDTIHLRELNLGMNNIEKINADLFRYLIHLKKINLTNNLLMELLPGTLNRNNELQVIDISHNRLIKFPTTLINLDNLRILLLNNNQIAVIEPLTLNNLPSLRTLKLTRNSIKKLKGNVFNKLQHLTSLDLDQNEIETIETESVRHLPLLKRINLSKNKIKMIPKMAFINLPTLQLVELQENNIRTISSEAFKSVPLLLMLNISHNQLHNISETGLDDSVKSLEMLDMSYNEFTTVFNPNMEKLEWMIELRMDNNKICNVNGSPFNKMLRLRVLSMRNNQLISFPEREIERIRHNIAILDIDGNPLICSCHLLWLKVWLKEVNNTNSIGPKCADGSLLKNMKLIKDDCSNKNLNAELIGPGCESHLVQNETDNKNNDIPPSPEESEYFYEEYIDYPLSVHNETNIISKNSRTNNNNNNNSKAIPKGVNNSPSSSGFTFFGLPLPNSIGKLFETHNNNNNNNNWSNRMAIVNKPKAIIPTLPNIENGGFIPMLPGSGGFHPIENPLSINMHTQHKKTVNSNIVISTMTPLDALISNVPTESENTSYIIYKQNNTEDNYYLLNNKTQEVKPSNNASISTLNQTNFIKQQLYTSITSNMQNADADDLIKPNYDKLTNQPELFLIAEETSAINGNEEILMKKKMATITKIQSPNTQQSLNEAYKRQNKNDVDRGDKMKENAMETGSGMSWYFATYNNSNKGFSRSSCLKYETNHYFSLLLFLFILYF